MIKIVIEIFLDTDENNENLKSSNEFDVCKDSIKYRKAMETQSKNGISTGYKSIGKSIGLTGTQSNNMYGYMKAKGIIEVINNQTVIKKWLK